MVEKQILNVVKRGQRGKEPLNIEKIHDMVEYAVEGIKGVSSSQVEMNSGLQFYDGITTDEIQQILIKSAADLISLENPNYQYVACQITSLFFKKTSYRQIVGSSTYLQIT
jgi:ribonucleoside-diphosphate reductase alpha chain